VTEAAVTAILFVDLVDSTGLLDRLGDEDAHRVSHALLATLRQAVSETGGREVKSLGDGLMAAFPSSIGAVRCALSMIDAVRAVEPGQGVRIGIDAGEPIVDSDDMFGTPVVVARRLCDLASSGQILVSGVLRSLVGRRVPATFVARGPTAVRGLSAPVDTWLVTAAGEAADGRPGHEPTQPIRVLISDDQRLVRAGFRVILDAEPDLIVVGEASDGLEAIDQVRRLAPHVVLMDIRMPNLDGLSAARRLAEISPATRVVVLTTFDADEYVYETLKLGASGFLLKDAPPEQLVAAVRCAARGDALIDPAVTKRLVTRFAQVARPEAALPEVLTALTSRELDVLRLMARGLSNSEIAAELVVEETTVKTHVARVLMKLGVRDRVQAVVFAYECGFVSRDAQS
jgi:DNA-binding NarL/FixJ family response regulator/class 3 adenylate cyclase